MKDAKGADCVLVAVAHKAFAQLTWEDIGEMYRSDMLVEERVLIDVKGIEKREEALEQGYRYWRL